MGVPVSLERVGALLPPDVSRRSLPDLMAAGRYGYVAMAINNENFPRAGRKLETVWRPTIVTITGSATNKDVLGAIKSEGLRPASARQLIYFASTHEPQLGPDNLIGLGSVWNGALYEETPIDRVVCTWGHNRDNEDPSRNLRLPAIPQDRWSAGNRFLAYSLEWPII